MNTNRVSGPTPSEPGKTPDGKPLGEAGQAKERVVGKVEEVDPDAQSKAKKFREALSDAENQFNDAKAGKEGHAPSPFETSFHTAGGEKKSLLGGTNQGPLSEPPTSPPPNVTAQPPTPPPSSEEEGGDLPYSDNFLDHTDETSVPPPFKQQFQESPQSAGRDEETPPFSPQQQKGEEKKEVSGAPHKKETTPSGRPGKAEKGKPSEEKKGGKAFLAGKEEPLAEKQKGKEKKPTPFEAPLKKDLEKEKEAIPSARPLGKEEEKISRLEKKAEKGAVPKKQEEAEKKIVPGKPLRSREEQIAQMYTAERRERERGDREREKRPIEIEGPSLPPLPPEIIPIAQAAATQAAPYLNPQVLPLFYQMVGTIHVLASQAGVSRTEVVLNAPSFANSRFYGSTILIEKYATAPDSINIRLSGSNEAVTAFNQNIPNLMAAFQNGNFSFRVNRIDAAYSAERPVFRRKEPRREKGGGGMDQNLDKR